MPFGTPLDTSDHGGSEVPMDELEAFMSSTQGNCESSVHSPVPKEAPSKDNEYFVSFSKYDILPATYEAQARKAKPSAILAREKKRRHDGKKASAPTAANQARAGLESLRVKQVINAAVKKQRGPHRTRQNHEGADGDACGGACDGACGGDCGNHINS